MASPEQDSDHLLEKGIRFHHQGSLDDAESIYKYILKRNPEHAGSMHLLGVIAFQRREYDAACRLIKKAIQNNGRVPDFHYNLGIVFRDQGRLGEAADCFQEALRLQSSYPEALNNLGSVYKDQGRLEEAVDLFGRAIEQQPSFPKAHSNLLFAMNYLGAPDRSRILKEHLRWAQQYADPLKSTLQPHNNDPSPDRPLRIGYLSPDFRTHSVAFFVEPLLTCHDRGTFEIFGYANVARPDHVTEKLQSLVHGWRNIRALSDEQVVNLIHEDGIDILIDLAGHTGNNRLLVFARKPAPIQMSYLGYGETTGLSTIDYRITDAWADPPGKSDAYYTEKLLRLPHGSLCYRPPAKAPGVRALPCVKTGRVTFGSFNTFCKINQDMVTLWSRIMNTIPDSRFIIKSRSLADPASRSRLREMFRKNSISSKRLTLIDYVPDLNEHLDLYNRIDIALDTFPYNGATTTCEAMWMGAPAITLAGDRYVSRLGATVLSTAGMTDLIAESPEAYIDRAVGLASDIARLEALRKKLREKLTLSPLTDADGFTRAMETAFRKAWHQWCFSRAQNNHTPGSKGPGTACEDHTGRNGSMAEPGERVLDLAALKGNRPTINYRPFTPDSGGFKDLVDGVYRKREARENLSYRDFMLMLADTILDQRFFQSRGWKRRYGGLRFYPDLKPISDPEKILVLEWPAALGDTAMAAKFFAALRGKNPRSHIALLGNQVTKSIYQASGYVDRFLDNPLESFLEPTLKGEAVPLKALMKAITDLVKDLAGEQFDLLYNLQILPMTATLAKLTGAKKTVGMTLAADGMPILSGNYWAPYLFGVSASLMRPCNRVHRTVMLQRLVDAKMDWDHGTDTMIGSESMKTAQKYFDDQGITDRDLVIGLSPMSNLPLKMWNRYDRLMRALDRKYHPKFLLFGSESERAAILDIINRSGVKALAATHFNLNELMAAIAGCDLFIANDTGPLHLACLLKRKTIALFGPTIAEEVGPWDTDHILLQSSKCHACFDFTCAKQPSCMDHISVDDVMQAVEYVLTPKKDTLTHLSSGISCRISEDRVIRNTEKEIISKRYLDYLETGGFSSPVPDPELPDGIRSFCLDFRKKVEEALELLEHNPPERILLEKADQEISTQCDFLETIIIFNDLKFLDKRSTIARDRSSYKRYYRGIIRDLDHFIGNEGNGCR